jgi:Ion channel
MTDHFGLVLASCLVTYTLLVSINSQRWVALAASLPVLVTVVLALWASAPGPILRWSALGLAGAAVLFAVIDAARHGPNPTAISMVLTGLSLAVCLVAMLARMALHTRVTVRTVLAVIAAYVMIGLLFAYLDSGIGHFDGNFFAQTGQHTQADYAYFSYITLTTTGFGDLTPVTGVARSITILEALMGQIFLVTLVARMVSLFGTERAPLSLRERREQREETSDDGAVASDDGPALPAG